MNTLHKLSLPIIASLLLLTIYSLLLPPSAEATTQLTTYHVALTGNDANDGSASTPFRTVKKGASVLQAGDTLIIHDGDYGQEFDIVLSHSGTVSQPITIKAETRGNVVLNGSRMPNQINGGGEGFTFFGRSHIIIDGVYMHDYSVALGVYGDPDNNGLPYAGQHITISHSTFKNNGDLGIEIVKSDYVLISHCTFIAEEPPAGWPDLANPDAIQDYGVYFWHTDHSIVEDSYFYGAHNQALSFKQGAFNSIARRNIFEGALYTAIYLGQNRREDGRPKSRNLTAEYNIVRDTVGYRTKSPIRVDNVENAIVRNNYVEGFDDTDNTSGINVFNEALGTIQIYDNIAAFGVLNANSGGTIMDWGLAATTVVSIHHNTYYSLTADFFGNPDANDNFVQNLSYQTLCFDEVGSENFCGNPAFINGDPVLQPISTMPMTYDFDSFYWQLVSPFRLAAGSSAENYGARITTTVPTAITQRQPTPSQQFHIPLSNLLAMLLIIPTAILVYLKTAYKN